jgi:NADH dehydrogenase
MGEQVKTLTYHPDNPDPFDGQVQAAPYDLDRPEKLVETLRGATALYNTYWVRLTHRGKTYEQAVENTRILFRAAQEAGVRRVVHVSISNPSLDSPLPYFHGKAVLEQALKESGLSYAILRPTVLFGPGCILLNNIAWFLRRFPFFAMPGSGRYRLQPVTLDDVGEIVADAALADGDLTVDAAGPEVLGFEDLVREVAVAIGCRPAILHWPPALSLLLLRAVGWLVGEVILSPEELAGLTAELLVSREKPLGRQSVRAWIAAHGDELGRHYASELARHVNRRASE